MRLGENPNALGATADLYGFRGPPSLAKKLPYHHHQHRQGVFPLIAHCARCVPPAAPAMRPPRCAGCAAPLCRLCRPLCRLCRSLCRLCRPLCRLCRAAVPAVPPRCAGCAAFPRQLCPPAVPAPTPLYLILVLFKINYPAGGSLFIHFHTRSSYPTTPAPSSATFGSL